MKSKTNLDSINCLPLVLVLLPPSFYIMATRVTWSQTHIIGPNPPLSPWYNPLSAFGSNQQGAEIVDQFLSFSAHQATPSISQNHLPQESLTPAVCIVILPDNYRFPESGDHLFGHSAAFDGGGEAQDPWGWPHRPSLRC